MAGKQMNMTPAGRKETRDASRMMREPEGALIRDLLDLLDDIDQPHTVEVHADGWSIKHSLACREDMFACEFHIATFNAGWDGPPAPEGEYLLTVDEGRPVLTSHVGSVGGGGP